MSFSEAGELWKSKIKGNYSSRDEQWNLLSSNLQNVGKKYNIAEDVKTKSYFLEGEKYITELTKRKRDRSLIRYRLEKDKYKCQNCGFSASTITGIPSDSILVEIHHINPIQDGERETKIEDLITLCPNCHKVIHAIGKEVDSNILSIDLLKKYYPEQKK